MRPTAAEVISLLKLQPHPVEGGFFRETYRSADSFAAAPGKRSVSTQIYYLLTPNTVSELHRLPTDECFHFYLGDPVEMLQLWPDGSSKRIILGTDLKAGQVPQLIVPGGVWQGTHLLPGGEYALLGATMAPGFDYADYSQGKRSELAAKYTGETELIRKLTPGQG